MTTLRHHIRATAWLAVPLIGSHLAQQAIGVADTVMTGWYGVDALAAVTLGATCFFIVWIVGSGFAMAVMPLVATAAADGDDRQVRRVTRMGLWAAIIMAVASYPLFFLSAPLLVALGQAPEIAEVAQGYLRIAGLGMAFSLMVTVLKSHLAALERTRMILLATVGGGAAECGAELGADLWQSRRAGAWGHGGRDRIVCHQCHDVCHPCAPCRAGPGPGAL